MQKRMNSMFDTGDELTMDLFPPAAYLTLHIFLQFALFISISLKFLISGGIIFLEIYFHSPMNIIFKSLS
eukprot:snap_masked-scaffold_25-processed-gene-5.25-mRNA-1 protein AED:1.00 eAED:1.00 QI:0/0/0/0/1/1/2/0/69